MYILGIYAVAYESDGRAHCSVPRGTSNHLHLGAREALLLAIGATSTDYPDGRRWHPESAHRPEIEHLPSDGAALAPAVSGSSLCGP